MALSGCTGIRHLQENEKMLAGQRINAPQHIDKDPLRALYAQKKNRTFLWTEMKPLVALYYSFWGTKSYNEEKYIEKRDRFIKRYDEKIAKTTSEKKIANYQFRKQKKVERMNSFIEDGNLFMQWGEPIAVFDSSLVAVTEERLHNYLFSKGYFTNAISSSVKFRRNDKKAYVEYEVNPGRPYFIDSIYYQVSDSIVYQIIANSKRNSFLKEDQKYSQENLTRERERIDLLLKDNGFYDFSRQYIEYRVDTTMLSPSRGVVIQVIINDPAKRGYHKQFQIDSVRFITDAGVSNPGRDRSRRQYREIQYNYYQDNYNLKILSQRVFLKPGDLYSRKKTLNTQRQLANVDAFKFININFDTTDGKFIAQIYSSPLPRYEWSNEAGVNVTQGYPGPFYSISFKKRNIFNGLESFELSGRFGFEGAASALNDRLFSREAGINASLTFPQFIFPFSERRRFQLAQFNPKTRFTLGYAFTERPEFRRTAFSLNGTYTWQNNKNRSYSFTPFSVSVIDTANLSADFKNLLATQLAQGNFSLFNSFRPSLVSSMLFGVTWNYNNYGNAERSSGFVRAQVEAGGTIWNFTEPNWVADLGLEPFQYLRFSLDLRRIHVINPNTTLAFRLNTGVAVPYGISKTLPYEKFFFAGGSNSIRAWRPRRLGPGSFKPDSSATPRNDGLFSYRIEKPAEILTEASIELRQKLFGFVSGALFIDAGNVWTFDQRTKTVQRESDVVTVSNGNAQFKLDKFYREIAVGTGFGLRFDFTFLILRFDVGLKVYDPARNENDRFVLDEVRFWKPYAKPRGDGSFYDYREPVIYNVGIGYSF